MHGGDRCAGRSTGPVHQPPDAYIREVTEGRKEMMDRYLGTIVKKVKRQIPGYFFLLPGFLFIFVFMIFPLFRSLYFSFTNYNFAYDSAPVFSGFDNYIKMFSDTYFLEALKNTLTFSILFFPSMMILSLILALLLDYGCKWSGFFRASIFLPVVLPLILIGVIFQWILNAQFGLLNFFIEDVLGISSLAKDWLGDANWAMVSIAFVSVWKYIGMPVVLFTAGLQAIPKSLFEAAHIDGASGVKQLIYVTLPNLRESFAMCGVWTIIQSIKVFEQPYIMTQGGPSNSTLVLYLYLYRNAFNFFDMGYASAIAYFMGIAILILSLLNLKMGKSE